MTMHTFDYAIVRVVPRVERAEFVNAGVILYCRTLDFLAARIDLAPTRLAALWPATASDGELEAIAAALAVVPAIAAGEADAGPIAALPAADRFHWLVAPKSTVVQTSPTHTGLCDDPQRMLAHLMTTMVSVGVSAR